MSRLRDSAIQLLSFATEKLLTSARHSKFLQGCGAKNWVKGMLNTRPFASSQLLFEKANTIWNGLSPSDWKEAFTHHPKIGELKDKIGKADGTATLAREEQSSVKDASSSILNELSRLNIEYEKRFGYIFMVCATGKTAEEMLDLLQKRIGNDPDSEVIIATEEQRKITLLRLEKLLT